MWFKQNLCPGILADAACKSIKKSTTSLKDAAVEIHLNVNTDEMIVQMTADMKGQLDRKKTLEDKAKSVLGGIALSVTAITFTLNNQNIKFSDTFNLIAAICLLFSIMSFVMATVRGLQALSLKEYYLGETQFERKENTIILCKENKREKLEGLIMSKLLNDNTVLSNGNYASAALVLLRNGLILFFLYFILSIVGRSLKLNSPSTANRSHHSIFDSTVNIKKVANPQILADSTKHL